MAWTINYTISATKQLRKLDKPAARRIVDYMSERVAPLADPRSTGKALTGKALGAFWRYRIGDYRVVCELQDGALCILVVELADRKHIYQ